MVNQYEQLYVLTYWLLRKTSLLKLSRDYLFLFKDLYILHANLENLFFMEAYGYNTSGYVEKYITPYKYTIAGASALIQKFKRGDIRLRTLAEFAKLYRLKLKDKSIGSRPVPISFGQGTLTIQQTWENHTWI